MPYRLFNNYVSNKSFRASPAESIQLEMRLADAYNQPLVLRQATADPGIFILRNFKWEFSERRKGGMTQVFTNVTITDADLSTVSLVIPPKTLTSGFGYRHGLLMKWPSEGETAWDLVGTGVLQILTQQADHLAVSG